MLIRSPEAAYASSGVMPIRTPAIPSSRTRNDADSAAEVVVVATVDPAVAGADVDDEGDRASSSSPPEAQAPRANRPTQRRRSGDESRALACTVERPVVGTRWHPWRRILGRY